VPYGSSFGSVRHFLRATSKASATAGVLLLADLRGTVPFGSVHHLLRQIACTLVGYWCSCLLWNSGAVALQRLHRRSPDRTLALGVAREGLGRKRATGARAPEPKRGVARIFGPCAQLNGAFSSAGRYAVRTEELPSE
jgi:hypothetical protein